MILLCKRLRSTAQLPVKHFKGDAGFDLFTSRSVRIPGRAFVDVHTDIVISMPTGSWGLILSRSSAIRTHGVRVETAVIDNGYRGELFIGVWNLGLQTKQINQGMRLAQLIILPRYDFDVHWVESLPRGDRDDRGFGSTGL